MLRLYPSAYMAPRPGLEPGTYGSTEERPLENPTRKSKIYKASSGATPVSECRPNLFRTSMVGYCEAFAERRSKARGSEESTERGMISIRHGIAVEKKYGTETKPRALVKRK
jgi:hypothetical protein